MGLSLGLQTAHGGDFRAGAGFRCRFMPLVPERGSGYLITRNLCGGRGVNRGNPNVAMTLETDETRQCVGHMQFLQNLRRRLEQLGPYPSLVVLVIPLAIVEPFKLVAVLVAGGGHFVTGMFFLVLTYVVSLLLTEWLFVALKPKLLMLPWFAKLWRLFVALRRRCMRWLRGWWPSGKFLFGR
jgi:hypothetical protein